MYQSFAIVMKNDQNEVWFVDLPRGIFDDYINEGGSYVGDTEDLLTEIRKFLDGTDV